MGQQGKPETLDKMKILAHSIDARHWEWVWEKSCSVPDKSNNNSNSSKSNKKSAPNNSDKSTSNKSPSKGSSTSNNNKSDKSKSILNPLADKLGKDSKLAPQEWQRRFDNKLCMFCGGTGHTAKDCTKSSSSTCQGTV